MEKTISVTDLKLIPELSHLRMLDFIDPKNDLLIAPYLRVLGFDLDYPIEYIPSQHRNLQGQKVIAYQIAGCVECNENFLSSSLATVEDRIIAAGYRDQGLARDMASSLSSSRDYVGEGDTEAFVSEPDEADVTEQIQILQNLVDQVRPNMYKEGGSLKTLAEYHAPPTAPAKERKKRAKQDVTVAKQH